LGWYPQYWLEVGNEQAKRGKIVLNSIRESHMNEVAQTGNINPIDVTTIRSETYMSFSALKQIDAGVLNVGYAEAGPTDGPVVMLLHGWPYDIHSFVDVVPILAGGSWRRMRWEIQKGHPRRFVKLNMGRHGSAVV
jgi:hypothetical protein